MATQGSDLALVVIGGMNWPCARFRRNISEPSAAT